MNKIETYGRHIYSQDIINAFEELGFEDSSWGNDLCDSIALDISKPNKDKFDETFTIYLANSKNNDEANEEFDSSMVSYWNNDTHPNPEEVFQSDDILEILSMFKSYKESK